MLTYENVVSYRSDHENNFNQILETLNKHFIKARDDNKINIYMTKYRVKTADSLYLKTKKDNTSNLYEINDIAGYRIVCLFEQDLLSVHNFILDSLSKLGYKVTHFKYFNWEEESIIKCLIDKIGIIDKSIEILPKNKPSKYKSIHYLIEYNQGSRLYTFEIQLRTLLQDVWGELEHALKYKQGNIHPHIKTSFILLARDLENNDLLMTHLRTISDKERVGHLYSMERGGPVNYYGYENDLIPDNFKSGEIGDCYNSYTEFMSRLDIRDKKHSLIQKARELYDAIGNKITHHMSSCDIKIKYFMQMEDAFLRFWEGGEGQLDNALKIYKQLEDEFRNNYILHFRMGEIYFIKGEIVKALVSFDYCENLLAKMAQVDLNNHFRVKFKLAYIYWLLGQEYITYTLQAIKDAEKIFNENQTLFTDLEKCKILNNLCSYHLDNYLITKSDDDYKIALEHLKNLESYIKQEEANANTLDTIAWFYYKLFLKDGNPDNLERAKQLCQLIGDRENYSTFKITSLNIHINHIQEIMCAK